jgi:hypothetical protein
MVIRTSTEQLLDKQLIEYSEKVYELLSVLRMMQEENEHNFEGILKDAADIIESFQHELTRPR